MSRSDVHTVSPSRVHGPVVRGEYPVWSASHGPVEVRFVGRGAAARGRSRSAVLEAVEGRESRLAELRQIHSARVVAAQAGPCGEGDALWTDRPGLVLSVVTADCVPVVLADPVAGRVAAVHAGWRGIVAGIVGEAVRALEAPAERVAAWVGPAIGACCYEVGEDVAGEVASAAGGEVVVRLATKTRPHLDLPGAVRNRLTRAGVPAPRVVVRCTRCDRERLWSYRREGRGGGRNHAFVWVRDDRVPSSRPV